MRTSNSKCCMNACIGGSSSISRATRSGGLHCCQFDNVNVTTYNVEGIVKHNVVALVKVGHALLAAHELDLLVSQCQPILTHHVLRRLRRVGVPQQETTAGLQQIGDVLDVELEVVQEHLEHVQDGVGAGNLELGKLSVEPNILQAHTVKLADSTLALQIAHLLIELGSVPLSHGVQLTLFRTATPTSGM